MDLLSKGMIAGHLKAMRRDLFRDVGEFSEEFPGCQDYEFAIRVSVKEPILLIPEFLYRYRWHGASQSVHKIDRQNRIASAVRRAAVRRVFDYAARSEKLRRLSSISRGICLVRTQGKRMQLLEETVHSILLQDSPITPCIITHGTEEEFRRVSRWAQQFGNRVVALHADASGRGRGYPLNVGLEYALKSKSYDYLCILDDDDIYYPLFGERMVAALNYSGADVVFCKTNRCEPGGAVEIGVMPLPPACLISGNFFPINSFAIRLDFLSEIGAKFLEDINYLEDWDFLLSLMGAGAQTFLLPETLAEFRIIGDGNRPVKSDPEHYEYCRSTVMRRVADTASLRDLVSLYESILEFDFDDRPDLDPDERDRVFLAWDIARTAAQ